MRAFTALMLESEGAMVEPVEPEALDALLPERVQRALCLPEFARLGFGFASPGGAIPVGIEGDWLERFARLLGGRGRLAVRALEIESAPEAPADAERLLAHAFTLQNGIFRLSDHRSAAGALILLTFRYAARSDEKREGLVTLGINLDTGSLLAGDFLAKLVTHLSCETEWRAPSSNEQAAIPDAGLLARRLEPAIDTLIRRDLANFEAAMRKRLDRDAARVHAFHDDLRRAAQKKLGALGAGTDEKTESQRRREMLRIEAIEREYAAKAEDLRRNYALSISIEWAQGLLLFAPVERYELLIKRRKGERRIVMDWHKALRLMEPPPADWGAGLGRVRLACDDHLHLTDAQGQAPCPSCAKAYCRACHPDACPRCGAKMASPSDPLR